MKARIHAKWSQASNHKMYSTNVDVVDAQVVKENKKTVWVRLPDKNIIKRKKSQIVE